MTFFGKPDVADLVRRNKPHSLTEALDHKDPEVRAAAATGLADLGEMHALEPLATHVQSDPDPEVREAAAAALQRLLNEMEAEGPRDGDEARWKESLRTFRGILNTGPGAFPIR